MSYTTFGYVDSIFKRNGDFWAEIHYDSHIQCTLKLTSLEALRLNEGNEVKISVRWLEGRSGQSVHLVRPITLLVTTPPKEVQL